MQFRSLGHRQSRINDIILKFRLICNNLSQVQEKL